MDILVLERRLVIMAWEHKNAVFGKQTLVVFPTNETVDIVATHNYGELAVGVLRAQIIIHLC